MIVLSLSVIFVGGLILALTENQRFIKIIFEVTSAFGTVGLSAGITSQLSVLGKLVITIIMFIGRLGPLTIITALAKKRKTYEVRYPDGKVSIG